MKFQNTKLQKIEFGDEPADQYYCLIDLKVSPDGLDINKMKLTDPRNIDQEFRNHGVLMMFTGEEIESLINRGDLDREKLHESLYERALGEGVIKEV
ncbi:MAG: hypothetical protein R3220_03425 [Balneolaceae bacterium]|nr:hypothetical protein [Balneolaceae bacterium]